MQQQRGVVLIVTLVILAVLTIAGVATMQNTGMQLQMATATQDRQSGFEAAEAVLRMAEQTIQENNSGLFSYQNAYYECTGSNCFNDDCDNGQCFNGVYYEDNNEYKYCLSTDDGSSFTGSPKNKVNVTPRELPPWWDEDLDVWNTSGKHKSVTLSGVTNPVKLIIEFRCFMPANPAADLGQDNAAEVWRITTRAKSNSGSSEVMLQSTVKKLF